jgi:hypothetical protein
LRRKITHTAIRYKKTLRSFFRRPHPRTTRERFTPPPAWRRPGGAPSCRRRTSPALPLSSPAPPRFPPPPPLPHRPFFVAPSVRRGKVQRS